MKTNSSVTKKDIKEKIEGFSGGIVVVTTFGFKNVNNVVAYFLSSSDLNNDTLRSMLFGRVTSNGEIKLVKKEVEYLANNWAMNTLPDGCSSICNYQHTTCANLRADMIAHDEMNVGGAGERFVMALTNGKHGTKKQDKNQKIDIISSDGKRWQVKTCICDEKGSYSITNGSVR